MIESARIPVVAVAGVIAAVAVAAGSANAGIYRVAQCHPGFGAGPGAASFQRTSEDFRRNAACGEAGPGLEITHRAGKTPAGRWGRWRIHAPAGTGLEEVRARVSARGGGGYVPDLLVELPGGGADRIPGIFGQPSGAHWRGSGTELVARLACARASGPCGRTDKPRIRVKRVLLTLRDRVDPQVRSLGGSLFAAGTQRGERSLGVHATDVGGGVRRVTVLVNRQPVGGKDLADGECALERGVGTNLTPCPLNANVSFPIETSGPSGTERPFRQGPNSLRICVLDQALAGTANVDCRGRRVWLDNACPVVGSQGVARLEARFKKGGKSPKSLRVRQGNGATLMGRALDASGDPVAGATVCVGARLDHPGTPERIVRERLETGSRGKFRLHVAPGASRLLRVAHWSSSTDVKEKRLKLGVSAKPKLRLSPDRVLHNGDTLHFHVQLRGPYAGHKRVGIRVKPPGSEWQLVSEECLGRTKRSGRFHCAYTFGATSGRRTYAFRAVVPKQSGYPFLRGHSETRRQTVVGP